MSHLVLAMASFQASVIFTVFFTIIVLRLTEIVLIFSYCFIPVRERSNSFSGQFLSTRVRDN